MEQPLTWVVGRGGLLGRQVELCLAGTGLWRPAAHVPWSDEDAAAAILAGEAERFLSAAGAHGGPWRILWCAGAGVVATPPEALAQETRLVERALADLAARLAERPGVADRGTVMLASSAGGVYAASPGRQPFDEESPVCALAPYGREKLAQEDLFRALGARAGVDVLIGRFSNLYGPGQSLDKPQGLISHIGRAALRREPVSIYVSLDTIRDYLFAPDAGRMVVAALARMEDEREGRGAPATVVKVFASEVETTIASVLGAWRRALGRPPLVALAARPATGLQPRLLSFRSRVWPEVLGRPTLLSLGVEAVRRDQLARLLAGGLR
ncbi:MAG: NAD-dependent epimerase/dehydratase family protein [Thermoleophilia bacterium]|nr:NAD-dependent epimerase/dehydratase family protein [Thermoleophilia bacterium]